MDVIVVWLRMGTSMCSPWPGRGRGSDGHAVPRGVQWRRERVELCPHHPGVGPGLVLGMARQDSARRCDDFPKPVVKVGRLHGWLLADVMAPFDAWMISRFRPLSGLPCCVNQVFGFQIG
jgi:hypothetical protein